ncbi:MAG TPA: RNA polymerase sigma factor [Gemmataceae bacterium]|nr:RNA polymerase sigma factor [Gemmataceae bacterium]
MTKPDDQRLLNDLRAGRSEACGEVIRGHYQAVYRFLVHMTRDVHEAEDLTQETFAAAWQQIGAFEGRSTLATWLHRIAYTKFIDAQRAVRRNARLRERLPGSQMSSDDPLDSVTADDESRRLYQAMQGLENSDRTLIVLHYLQGLSYREMSSVLDEPTGTLKWRTSEALNRLRSLLTDEVPHHVR